MSTFVANIDEIQEACPNSRWKKVDKLLSAIGDEELSLLQPILGETLMTWLAAQSDDLRQQLGTLVDPNDADLTDAQKATIALLTQVRKAVIFRMLSNNTEILSVSLNEGGGHNRTETDEYAAMTMDDLEKLAKKYFHKSIDRIETMLILLEKDAKSDAPVFSAMWQESEYFYLHADLLFPHLRSIQHYYKQCDGVLKFANLCPDIRYCQQTYIAPIIGEDVVTMLCEVENPAAECTKISTTSEDSDTTDDTEESTTTSTTTAADKQIRLRALALARTALGLYVSSRTATKDDRSMMLDSASMAASQLVRYISQHQSSFGDAIKTSPLYTPTSSDTDTETSEKEKQPRPTYSAISTLGRGLRRY